MTERRFFASDGTGLVYDDLGAGTPIVLCHGLAAGGAQLFADAEDFATRGYRVLVPDLGLWCQNYVADNSFFFDEYRRGALNDDKVLYPTKGSVFMGMLHNHGHKMGYDFDTLSALLARTGFERIRRTMVQDSDLEDIATVEPYFPLKALETLCVECYKPA